MHLDGKVTGRTALRYTKRVFAGQAKQCAGGVDACWECQVLFADMIDRVGLQEYACTAIGLLRTSVRRLLPMQVDGARSATVNLVAFSIFKVGPLCGWQLCCQDP